MTETDPVSEKLFSSYLEFLALDKVLKPSDQKPADIYCTRTHTHTHTHTLPVSCYEIRQVYKCTRTQAQARVRVQEWARRRGGVQLVGGPEEVQKSDLNGAGLRTAWHNFCKVCSELEWPLLQHSALQLRRILRGLDQQQKRTLSP
jgi:hypothetical protein